MHLRKFLALLLLLALVIAACGGDGDENDDNTDDNSTQTNTANNEAQNNTTANEPTISGVALADLPVVELGDDAQSYLWENFGVTLEMPAEWMADTGISLDYDFSVVSPNTGAALTFRVYPSLGTDSLEEALQPIVTETGAEPVAFGDDSLGVMLREGDYLQSIVLFRYNEKGAALVVQGSGTTLEDLGLFKTMFEQMEIDPPTVDVAAADAAFQASLEADGTLVYGEADAPVVMREYFSYTCGHCATYTLPIENLVALDVEAGRARFELAPLGGDPKSLLATHATYCAAEQGKGYSAYKALFQDYLTNGYEAAYTADSVNAILTGLGLDMDAVNACINDGKYQPAMDQVRLGFTELALTGTPTITLASTGSDPAPIVTPDGTVWSGTIPLAALRDIIDLMVTQDLGPQDAANVYFGG